jgi:hypothetical protein
MKRQGTIFLAFCILVVSINVTMAICGLGCFDARYVEKNTAPDLKYTPYQGLTIIPNNTRSGSIYDEDPNGLYITPGTCADACPNYTPAGGMEEGSEPWDSSEYADGPYPRCKCSIYSN